MILDTNALSALADGAAVPDVARDVSVLSLPVVVLGEFEYGIAASRHRARYQQWLAALVDVSWIAALALQHDLPVLSRDEHFDRVRGVRRVPF